MSNFSHQRRFAKLTGLDPSLRATEGSAAIQACSWIAALPLVARNDRGSVAFNVLIGFAVFAITAGLLNMMPSEPFALALGGVVSLLGYGLLYQFKDKFWLLGQICLVVGLLIFATAFVTLFDEPNWSYLVMGILYLAVGFYVPSKALLVLSGIAFLGAVDRSSLSLSEPSRIVILFTFLSVVSFWASHKTTNERFRKLLTFDAKASLVYIHIAFFMGALWGEVLVSKEFFSILWAMSIVVLLVVALIKKRKVLANMHFAFGIICFYTHWFRYLPFSALMVLSAGVIAAAFGFGIRKYNQIN